MPTTVPDQPDKTLKCIRCGFCLDACPTFRITGNEADSPRGRIYLMRSVQEGALTLDNGVVRHLDACLGCRACETACPSGVEYGSILEHFRANITTSGLYTPRRSFALRQLLATLTSPFRLAASLKAGSVFSKVTGGHNRIPAPIAELLTGKLGASVAMPGLPEHISLGRLPEYNAAIGTKKFTVAVLAGCVMRVMFHKTNQATVRVLQRAGCDVIVPGNAGCCGALHLHSGFMPDALERGRALIDALSGRKFDALIVNSAGCGSTLKEYGELFKADPVYASKAATLANRVKDVSEFLYDIGSAAPNGCYDRTVAYHDACHLAHGQKITKAPRELLQGVPGLKLVEIPESDTCCGSAGIYNITQPDMARKLLERKVDFIAQSGASVLATGNPGCMAWIKQGLQERGIAIEVKHPIEILDAAGSLDPIS